MHLMRISVSSACAFFAALLTGCGGPSAEVTGARRAEVEKWVTADYGYRDPLKFDSVWYSQGYANQHMACGQFESPPEFGGDPRYIRFIYDFQTGVKQVEMHRLWATGSGVSQAIMEQNRTLFDGLWKDHCARFHP